MPPIIPHRPNFEVCKWTEDSSYHSMQRYDYVTRIGSSCWYVVDKDTDTVETYICIRLGEKSDILECGPSFTFTDHDTVRKNLYAIFVQTIILHLL